DNVSTAQTSLIRAGATVTILGDYRNADPGVGSAIDLGGSITPGPGADDSTRIVGGPDDDAFTFNQTFLGGQTFVSGGDGQDRFTVNQLKSMTSSRPPATPSGTTTRRDTLDLDGQANTDTYTVNTTGSLSPAPSDYVINVLDTGAKDDGVDKLIVNGTDNPD